MIRLVQGQVADLPAGMLDRLPPLLATGPLPHDALAAAAVSGQQGLAAVAAVTGQCWIQGEPRDCLTLRHVALQPGAPADLAGHLVRHLLTTSPASLVWAPAGVENAPWGFWRFVNGCRLSFPPGRPAMTATAGLRTLGPADREAVYELARQRSQELCGPGALAFDEWQRRSAVADGGWLGYERDGRLLGAIGMRFERRDEAVRATALCLLDKTPEAYASLLGYLAQLCDSCAEVAIETLPPDRPGIATGDIVSKQRAELDRSWTVRVGSPEAWLPAMRYTAAGEIRLGIRDPLGLWPEAVALKWQDGRLTDWAPIAAADLQVRIDALMGLASGQLTPDHLIYRDWLSGPAADQPALAAIWAVQPLHRFGWDRS